MSLRVSRLVSSHRDHTASAAHDRQRFRATTRRVRQAASHLEWAKALRWLAHRRRAIAAASLLLLALVGYGIRLGYPFGPIFTIVPAERAASSATAGTTAVYVSGDLGFNKGMGPRVARHFAQQGIATVGVNSLSAFGLGGDATTAAEIVRAAIVRALAVPGTRRVLLIGQSFGANIVLAGATALPPLLRAHVPLVALVVPVDTMQFRATPGGIVGETVQGPALPYARRLTTGRVVCIHGETEEGSLCPEWRQANVHMIALPGDHFLQHDDALVAATLLHAYNASGRATALPKVQARPNSPQHSSVHIGH